MSRTPSFVLSLTPVCLLIALLALNVYIFGDNAIGGANQLTMLFVSAVATVFALRIGIRWKDLHAGMIKSIAVAMPAILILLMVGALSGTWLLGGVVPAMIYYGLYILDPNIFLLAACVISIVVSVATGSSWTASATVGVALMGIGIALGFNPAMTAGAILSGAYFGDKMSPLSDTTNLAAAVSGADLFTHIRYMFITTGPSIVIALVVFAFMGIGDYEQKTGTREIQDALAATFNINGFLLIAPLSVIVMIVKRVPALPALFVGSLLGALLALTFQSPLVESLGQEAGYQKLTSYAVILTAFYGETSITTGSAVVDELLSSGGMAGMLNTIWLILCAMIFGGVMEASGFLRRITSAIVLKARTQGQLFSATVGTCIFTNVSASDQYLSIIVPGQMYREAYKDRGLEPQNLSRTLEDSGTVTSVLVPWNTCGAFHAGVLGVATLSYAPFAVFCFISPIMTLLFAFSGYKIAKTGAVVE
ncbi:Na+/H+ antiporter NhaC [Teredinibacter haidensis]|uniref:Na+/H+ antiporter NhaC n=1 Tax=Teredinibacter haidensis TaxID=2731755 RepID=UPI000948A1B7|nr:Na+/H+ antiporter NhaC [Teredinibacter haidensis]